MVKAIVEFFIIPSTLIATLVIASVLVLAVLKRYRLGVSILAVASICYLALSSGVVASMLLRPLEYRHAPAQEQAAAGRVSTIVVLTGYARTSSGVPITGHVNNASGFRVLEAARLYQRNRRARVIVSGTANASVIMQELFIQLGVAPNHVSTDAMSNSTYDSAVNLRERLAGVSFYLVTSAGHMPRAMAVFEKQGLRPLAAPTDYLSSKDLRNASLLPSGQHLYVSDLAVHEYVGWLWYKLLGRI